ncbi:cytochrome P450 [Actinomadura sp. 9N215]|uniref:cytochrome P450 n=1 Tax=Actinomadura sp. 9N215 TaxID=3375150 RepID=UPI0037AB8BD3
MKPADCPRFPFPRQDVPPDGRAPDEPLSLSSHYEGLPPVTRVVLPEGQEAFLVTGYAECSRVLREQGTFQRADADAIPPFPRTAPSMLARDGDDHRLQRDLVGNAFAPARIGRYRPAVEKLTTRLVDALLAAREPVEINDRLAMPLTLSVMGGGVLGIPEDDLPQFRTWGDLFLSTGPDRDADHERAVREMGAYMGTRLARLMADPNTDSADGNLLDVIAANAVRSQVGLEDTAVLAAGLVIAGWETTAAAISSFLFRLLTTTGKDGETLYTLLGRHPDSIPGAVEELLRTTPGTIFDSAQPRRAVSATDLGGVRVREGDLLIPAIDRANRDPGKFGAPDQLDFQRPRNAHLSFGTGPHVCLGAPLARLELCVVLEQLTRRIPEARLSHSRDEVVWNDITIIRRPAELWLDLAPVHA